MNWKEKITMPPSERQTVVDSYKLWWHTIDFGDGIYSNGSKAATFSRNKATIAERDFRLWRMRSELFEGKHVLDIGAWDGAHSFLAERWGAKSVTALDNYMNKPDSPYQEGFKIAKKILNSEVKMINMDLIDATPENIGKYDVILFAGVLYHLDDPYRSLKIVKELLNEGGMLFIETHCTIDMPDIPIMVFHPADSLNGDSSNIWSPNELCLTKMMEELGDMVFIQSWHKEDRLIQYWGKKESQ